MTPEKDYFNYAASFSDWTFKTGVTASPLCRLQDFIQEATRHSVRVDGFLITVPSRSKRIALDVETSLCRKYEHYAIEGHREWFRENTDWMPVRFRRWFAKTHDHLFAFELFCDDLHKMWIRNNLIVPNLQPDRYSRYRALMATTAKLGAEGCKFSVSELSGVL